MNGWMEWLVRVLRGAALGVAVGLLAAALFAFVASLDTEIAEAAGNLGEPTTPYAEGDLSTIGTVVGVLAGLAGVSYPRPPRGAGMRVAGALRVAGWTGAAGYAAYAYAAVVPAAEVVPLVASVAGATFVWFVLGERLAWSRDTADDGSMRGGRTARRGASGAGASGAGGSGAGAHGAPVAALDAGTGASPVVQVKGAKETPLSATARPTPPKGQRTPPKDKPSARESSGTAAKKATARAGTARRTSTKSTARTGATKRTAKKAAKGARKKS